MTAPQHSRRAAHKAHRSIIRYEFVDDYVVLYFKRRSTGEIIQSLIDADDLDRVLDHPYSWFPNYAVNNRAYYIHSNGFRTTDGIVKRIDGSLLHRFIVNAPKNCPVDHINRDTLDNRKVNLRICTPRQNNFNRLGHYQIVQRGTTHWKAALGVKGTLCDIGWYETKREAEIAVFAARLLADRLESIEHSTRPVVGDSPTNATIFQPSPGALEGV